MTDKSFEPVMVVVNQGDRVWWKWDTEACANDHCIYQVDPPPADHETSDPFKPTENVKQNWNKCTMGQNRKNKAVYTTAPVAGGWAGAVMSWAGAEMI